MSFRRKRQSSLSKKVVKKAPDSLTKYFDQTSFGKMSFDKMSFDKMSFDKMSFDKMSFDKMSFDKMPFDHNFTRARSHCAREVYSMIRSAVKENDNAK
jgi:hypothetical protein